MSEETAFYEEELCKMAPVEKLKNLGFIYHDCAVFFIEPENWIFD